MQYRYRVTINITPQDYRDGRELSIDKCPIALALNRVLGGIWHAYDNQPMQDIARNRILQDIPPHIYKFMWGWPHYRYPEGVTFDATLIELSTPHRTGQQD